MRPARLVEPKTVAELQAILADEKAYPSPVRAVGSFHSLTPCPVSEGTVVCTRALREMREPDRDAMTFTCQAGVEMVEAKRFLQKRGLQFHLNIEIGNMTVGSAACCHTKDALDGVGFGQVSSYVTRLRWVTPDGGLAEVDEDDPELLALARSSYGLAGVIYEVTFKIKPLEIVHFDYRLHDVDSLTQADVDAEINRHRDTVCWTVGRTVVLEHRDTAERLARPWLADVRRLGWAQAGALIGQAITRLTLPGLPRRLADDAFYEGQLIAYRLLRAVGGFSCYDPAKMIDYSNTARIARYAFTFWTFPREYWVENLKAYFNFRDEHFERTGFRCNLPLGSYFVRKDQSSVLSYSFDGDMFSLDPIHAPASNDREAWWRFLREFNEWAAPRRGRPLLNQSHS
jgi:FAD/FMN-containing dehydrogenase